MNENIDMDGIQNRLDNWRNNLQDQIQNSSRKAIDRHNKSSLVDTSDDQQVGMHIQKISDTAIEEVKRMKSYDISEEAIRETILQNIQNMPIPELSESSRIEFNALREQALDRIDAEIVGNSHVLDRNLRM